ncbi:MAG: PC4/YdbC family ssDNA-binding protein [Treponema sp.]|nr:PC4/YdbC family ssDNA-binding protein [Treponema sp.]
MESINFDIVKHYGVISTEKSGWRKELNLVSWNGRAPKLDLRDWAPDHEKMGKGVTLTKEEAAELAKLLNSDQVLENT